MFNSTLEIIIKARDEASQAVNGITGKLKSMEPQFKSMAVAGTVAFTAITAVAISTVKAYADAQAQTEITNQSLSNTLNNLSAGSLTKLKKQLGVTGDAFGAMANKAIDAGKAAVKLGFDDETAANSFSKLFAATKDATEATKELQIAEDLARYKNISLEEATQKLILVHAGATKELKALGLAVDKSNTSLQNMDSIAKQVSGSAQVFSETTKGAMEKIKVRTDNLKEAIGGALEPAFSKLLATVAPLVEKFTAWAEKHPDLIAKIILIAGAIAGLVAVVGTLGLLLPPIIAGFTLLISPIGLVVLGVIALGAVVALVIAKWKPISAFFKDVWEGLKIIFKEALDAITGFFSPLINVVEKIEGIIKNIGSGIANVAKSVGAKISSVFSGRAQGGNVSAGTTYLVGENGAETFTPSTGGVITPNNKIGRGGGNSYVVNINGGNYLSQDAALFMGDKIIRALQMQMRGS